MSLSKQYQTNTDKELQGAWAQMGVNDKNKEFIEFCVARMSKSNTEYTKCFERITKPFAVLMRMGQLPKKKGDELMMQVFIQSVLKDWKNVPLSDVTGDKSQIDEIAPFTPENATKLFTRLPELYDRLFEFAGDASAFKDAETEEKAKN